MTSAVITAVAGTWIAAGGTWIALRQMLIANEKLQFDAFHRQYDRRVAVYEATREFLASVFHGNLSEDTIRAYRLHTLDANILFDDDIYQYLRELCQRVTALNDAESSLEHSSGDDAAEFRRIRTENLNWVRHQGDEQSGFAKRFIPFLVYRQAKRAWLLRWP